MGLFDIFSSNVINVDKTTSVLKVLLGFFLYSATVPAYRADFYKNLL